MGLTFTKVTHYTTVTGYGMRVVLPESGKQYVTLLDMRPQFKPQVKHQNENMKKYYFDDLFSEDFGQKL